MDETQNPTPDAPVVAPSEQPAPAPEAIDWAAKFAELTATVESLKADKQAAVDAAEQARQASMTEAERVADAQAKVEAERAALETERRSIVAEARAAAADKLGIFQKALALAPDVDPRTPEGAKALSDWAKDNPEFVKAQHAPTSTYEAPPKSNLAQQLMGAVKNPYMSVETLRKLVN